MAKCNKPGGTQRAAIRGIFKSLVPGTRHEFYVYECTCGKWHITSNPK